MGLVRRLYSPISLVVLGTFWPFLVCHSDLLTARTRGLSQRVGVDAWLYPYAITCVLAFWLGYTLFTAGGRTRFASRVGETPSVTRARCRRMVVVTVVLFLTGGFAILLYALSDSYMEALVRAMATQQANAGLRESSGGFLASTKVPGVIRMFAFLIVGSLILLYGVALGSPSWSRGWRSYRVLLALSVVAVLCRSLVVLDRYAPAAVALLGLFVLSYRMRSVSKAAFAKVLAALVLLVAAAAVFNVASSVRLRDATRRNPILEYADQGMANASLAFRTTTQFSWGTATLIGPVLMVPRALGLNYEFPSYESEWIWNPASNLLCTSIHEFGVFGFIIYFTYGAIVGRILRHRRMTPESVFWSVAHIWGLYVLLSIWTQPVAASPDMWTGIFATLIVGSYLDRVARQGERGLLMQLNTHTES